MNRVIEDEIVNSIWQEVASLNDKQASQSMTKLGERQADLLTFVTASLDDLSQEAIEIGVYVFYVVFRIFEKSSNAKLKRISAKKIASAYQKNHDLLLKLDGAHDRFLERIAEIETLKQPHVMRYVVEAIMEADGYEDPVFLTEEEIGSIFLILKSVIDVLDNARNKNIRGL